MSILVLFSLLVKCLGAVLEIGSQALISQLWSVETYGTYAFFVALAAGYYSLFFSGIIKFNNYYIPRGENVGRFRKRYYLYYAIPVSLIGIVITVYLHNSVAFCAFGAGFAYFCAMDTSSRMMSFGRYKPALIGEYCIGRSFVTISILFLSYIKFRKVEILYVIYGLQFCVALAYYRFINRKKPLPVADTELEPNARFKYVVFQSTEIAHTIIMQTSVIVQYFFGGAFQTALISIVLVVRKLINFITGPTSKLYQPEFSRRYAMGDKKGLADVYAQITRIQLCFMMPVFTLLIIRPEILLRVFNSELISYGWLVRITSVVFLTIIAFGPTSNFLPMIGKEKIDTIANWSSVLVMYTTMLLFRSNQFFVVIGFCSQILYINIFKYVLFLYSMKCLPMPVVDYIKLTMIWLAAGGLVYYLPNSILVVLLVCALHFVANFVIVFPKDDMKELLDKVKLQSKRNG